MQTPNRMQLLACALLFWASALGRYACPPRLTQPLDASLRQAWEALRRASDVATSTTVRVATIGGAALSDPQGLRIGALARLNGHVVHELAPAPRRDGVLELLLPKGGGGLLEIRVAVINSTACVTAAASELRWLEDAAALDALALVVRLTPLHTPLCN